MDTISDILAERGNRYGDFKLNACISQQIKDIMHGSPGWRSLSPDKREALDQTASKISRILTGDPEYPDSWADISGYSKLIADSLTGNQTKTPGDAND